MLTYMIQYSPEARYIIFYITRARFERGERAFHTRLLLDETSGKRERHAVETWLQRKRYAKRETPTRSCERMYIRGKRKRVSILGERVYN